QYPGLTNPNKAQVINMSLGNNGPCGITMQSAINTAVANGAIVVVAAGNANCAGATNCTLYNVSDISPANCANVISVSAKGNTNDLSWYSSYGNTTITASGGNLYPYHYTPGVCYSNETCSDIWGSTHQYKVSDSPTYISYEGTSQAAPHVSAVIADLITFFHNKGLSYNLSTIISILQNSASQLDIKSNYNATPRTHGQGGSVSGFTLNANNALLYAESYANLLHVYPEYWLVTSFKPQIFTFTNESMLPVAIESFLIVVSDSSLVSSLATSNDHCVNRDCYVMANVQLVWY
ncbi:MAG: S8 family serine peptidase, partial [Burkholderiales bacterium]|nr:S8 family serine peptidase [Burkholderiales bacterium]